VVNKALQLELDPRPTAEDDTGIRVTLDELIALQSDAEMLLWRKANSYLTRRSGLKHTKQQGRGIHFSETRIYQPGDDIRHIDWHATLRTNQTHTKLFHEEKERPIWLLVDHNPSMYFATRMAFKSVIAARAAALCAWAFSTKGERVGGLVFSGKKQLSIHPRERLQAVLPLLKHLADSSVQPAAEQDGNSLELAFNFLLQRQLHGGLIIVLSDFWQWHNGLIARLQPLARKNQCVAVIVQDPLESALPQGGYYPVSDGHTQYMLNTYDTKFKDHYSHIAKSRQQELQQSLQQLNMTAIPLSTAKALVPQLKPLFI
jgi:uncharacterized protein (DUF58 family)